MDAEKYNRIRRILFSTANDKQKGFSLAYDWMEKTYRRQLDTKSYVGLMAELKFYDRYGRDYFLTVAGDMGEHADFSGIFGGAASRFDVTTNLNYKYFQNYEPYLSDGPVYQIVLVDPANYEVSDIVSLRFQRCGCGGYLIPFIVMMNQNYNRHDDPQLTNDQIQMSKCNSCDLCIEINRYTHHGMSSPSEHVEEIPDEYSQQDIWQSQENYVVGAYKYFRRQFDDTIMAIADHRYVMTERDGAGYWAINFWFKNQVISGEMPDEIVP